MKAVFLTQVFTAGDDVVRGFRGDDTYAYTAGDDLIIEGNSEGDADTVALVVINVPRP